MEFWNDGILGNYMSQFKKKRLSTALTIIPVFHYSIVPLFPSESSATSVVKVAFFVLGNRPYVFLPGGSAMALRIRSGVMGSSNSLT